MKSRRLLICQTLEAPYILAAPITTLLMCQTLWRVIHSWRPENWCYSDSSQLFVIKLFTNFYFMNLKNVIYSIIFLYLNEFHNHFNYLFNSLMSRTLLICRTLHQDKYSFQVFASWFLKVSFIEILQTCYKQSLHSIWTSFTTYLNSYLQIWRPIHFWHPTMVLRYTFCFDPYCLVETLQYIVQHFGTSRVF